MTSGLPLYLSHIGSICQKDAEHTVMMPRHSLVSGQTAANRKADGMMYPLHELNVIGWHFPLCLLDKTAEYGLEQKEESYITLIIYRIIWYVRLDQIPDIYIKRHQIGMHSLTYNT